jgi:hypothetical protein
MFGQSTKGGTPIILSREPQHIARFTATEKAALEKAARDDARPVAALMTKIICDWLRERKYLK